MYIFKEFPKAVDLAFVFTNYLGVAKEQNTVWGVFLFLFALFQLFRYSKRIKYWFRDL